MVSLVVDFKSYQRNYKESGDKLIDYNKRDWIDMKQKVKWGNNTYDIYRSPDNLYDILYIEGKGKQLNKTAMFPVKSENGLTRQELSGIVAQTFVGLF